MKQLLLIITLCCIGLPIWASKIAVEDTSSAIIYKPTIVAIPSNTVIKKLLGRKLALREKLGLLFVRATYKNGILIDPIEAKKANTNAILGFMFSMLSILFSILGIYIFPFFAIPAYVLCNNMLLKEKKQPGLLTSTNKMLAQIGKITAIVIGILIVLLIALVFLLVSSLGNR